MVKVVLTQDARLGDEPRWEGAVVGMPHVGEFTNGCLVAGKPESVKFEQVDVLFPDFAEFGVHGTAIIAIARLSGGVILVGRVDKGSPRVHDTGDSFPAIIQVIRVFESECMSIFMGGGGGAFVEVVEFEVSAIRSETVDK